MIISVLLAAVALAEPPRIVEGELFPLVALPTLEDPGQPATLADYRGRKLVLHVFASW